LGGQSVDLLEMDRGKAVLPWPVARGPSGATGMVVVVVVVF
jgi:hypothetical protein